VQASSGLSSSPQYLHEWPSKDASRPLPQQSPALRYSPRRSGQRSLKMANGLLQPMHLRHHLQQREEVDEQALQERQQCPEQLVLNEQEKQTEHLQQLMQCELQERTWMHELQKQQRQLHMYTMDSPGEGLDVTRGACVAAVSQDPYQGVNLSVLDASDECEQSQTLPVQQSQNLHDHFGTTSLGEACDQSRMLPVQNHNQSDQSCTASLGEACEKSPIQPGQQSGTPSSRTYEQSQILLGQLGQDPHILPDIAPFQAGSEPGKGGEWKLWIDLLGSDVLVL